MTNTLQHDKQNSVSFCSCVRKIPPYGFAVLYNNLKKSVMLLKFSAYPFQSPFPTSQRTDRSKGSDAVSGPTDCILPFVSFQLFIVENVKHVEKLNYFPLNTLNPPSKF